MEPKHHYHRGSVVTSQAVFINGEPVDPELQYKMPDLRLVYSDLAIALGLSAKLRLGGGPRYFDGYDLQSSRHLLLPSPSMASYEDTLISEAARRVIMTRAKLLERWE